MIRLTDKLLIDKNLKISMNPFTLSFSDDKVEDEYMNESNTNSVLVARFGLMLSLLLFFGYGFLDPYAYPLSYEKLWIIRTAVVLFLFVSILYTYHKSYVKNMQAAAFVQLFVAGAGLISLFTFPVESEYKYAFTATYILLPIGLFILLGFRFRNAAIGVTIIHTVMTVVSYIEFNLLQTIYFLSLVTSVTFMIMVSGYFSEIYKRKLYLKKIYTGEILANLKKTKTELESANERLESLSVTDDLTRLNNRRYFNKIIHQESARLQRVKGELAFMMIDIDYFKLYNDTYGHLEGDKVLKEISQEFLKVCKRSTDFVFRLGGEEFGVVMSDTKYDECIYIAQKVCLAIEALKIKHEKSTVSEFVTVSVGVSINKAREEDEDTIIRKADEALYLAKNRGRNRYVVA